MSVYRQNQDAMDSHYQPFYRQAEALQNSFHARLADPFNPIAMMMKGEADRLVEDIKANKHPREVEERILSIQGHLRRVQDTIESQRSIISDEANQYLHSGYNRMRKELQGLPQYDRPWRAPGSAEQPQSDHTSYQSGRREQDDGTWHN